VTEINKLQRKHREPLSILMALPKYPYPIVGGLEKQAHELAETLVRQGHEVHVLTSLFDTSQKPRETIDGVTVYRLKWYDNPLIRYILMITGLARRLCLLRRKIDIVHIHQFTLFGVYLQVLSKMLGLPVITKLPNIGKAGIPGIKKRPLGKLQIRILKWADGIVAMNKYSIDELANINYPVRKTLKITNGIALGESEAKILHPAEKDDIVRVIFVGRLVEQKGLTTLLKAWKEMPEIIRSKTVLDLFGDGPMQKELQKSVSDAGLDQSVSFNGYSGDIPGELVRSHIFVLPSYIEGNSNAILEAMLAGLPIVATNVGGASIQVGGAGTPFLFEPGDYQALSDILHQLINDEELRRQTGEAMRKRVLSEFDIQKIAQTYEQAYQLILSGRRNELGHINKDLFHK